MCAEESCDLDPNSYTYECFINEFGQILQNCVNSDKQDLKKKSLHFGGKPRISMESKIYISLKKDIAREADSTHFRTWPQLDPVGLFIRQQGTSPDSNVMLKEIFVCVTFAIIDMH